MLKIVDVFDVLTEFAKEIAEEEDHEVWKIKSSLLTAIIDRLKERGKQ